MDHSPPVQAPPRPPVQAPPPVPSRPHSDRKEGGGKGRERGELHPTTHQNSKQISSSTLPDTANPRSSSDKENANVTKPTQRRRKVRFTDLEPEPTPLLLNARDSMYMRAELQRELDYGIPAQEEAHRYARWCAEEAKREAAEAESAESGNNYAKADMVIHPKRLSTDLSRMDIDLANLGEDVSGLDVFSRVEAALGKQQAEKQKQKAQKEKEKREKKEGSTREKLKASLLVSPKRENSYSSLDEPSTTPEQPREKKGSRFLRKVISDRVIKPREGSPSGNSGTPDDTRSKEIADFFGKLAAQASQNKQGGALLPPNAASTKPPGLERAHSDTIISRKEIPPPTSLPGRKELPPPTSLPSRKDVPPPSSVPSRKEVPSSTSLPNSSSTEAKRPSHPDIRSPPPPPPPVNGRPSSKPEPPPLPSPKQEKGSPPSTANGRVSTPTEVPPTIRLTTGSDEDGSTKTHLTGQSKPRERKSSVSQQVNENGGDKRRPSLPTHNTYPRGPVPSHSHSQSMHQHPDQSRASSLSSQGSTKPRPVSSAVVSPQPPPLSQGPPPPQSRPPPSADDFFSRIEQDIARNHPPPPAKEKKGYGNDADERTRDKGRKLFGKALEHIKHGGRK